MRIVVAGLAVSSSWGNGHATLWRGLVRALGRRRVSVLFLERDQPWYAATRDIDRLEGGELVLYPDWPSIVPRVRREIAAADAVIVTSYCPDAVAATRLVEDAPRARRIFYDLDTPVTLDAFAAHGRVDWLGPDLLAPFDIVLSYAGGSMLGALRDRLGARRVAPLYGHVDPERYAPSAAEPALAGDLSYLGTFAGDRQPALERMLLHPARRAPHRQFVVAGAQYPADLQWPANVRFLDHLPPQRHAALYGSSRATLNVTRPAMAASGWCPSGRLFEAAACGAAMISDDWAGLDTFFAPGREVIVARDSDDVLAALALDDAELARIGRAARERVLAAHTSAHRADELIALVEGACRTSAPEAADAMAASISPLPGGAGSQAIMSMEA